MLLERLEDYYGIADESIRSYIVSRLPPYDGEGEDKLYDYVVQNRSKRFGFPDISFMDKAFASIPPRKISTKFYWCVCDNCHKGYSYNLPYCPYCWDNGLLCNSYKVRVSEEKPPVAVIRYNKPYTTGVEVGENEKEPICYDCKNRNMSFCSNFGRTDYFCKDFNECTCKGCCVRAKKHNEDIAKAMRNKQTQYAIPFRKKEVI